MEGMIIRMGIILAGAILMASSFWMNAYKKITVNFAVIWEILGLMLVLVGIIPGFSQWSRLISSKTGLAFLCVGGIFLFEEVRTSVLLSQLMMKNRELAMQVSLLNQENEVIMNELDALQKTVEEMHEKDTLCG